MDWPSWPIRTRASSRLERVAAVHYQCLCGHHAGIGAKKYDGGGDISRRAGALEQRALDDRLLARLRPWPCPVGVDETRRDRVRTRFRRERAGQILREVDKAGLARTVVHAGTRHAAAG